MMIKLVVGLGNPGNEYSKTRHNIGFMALDQMAHRYQFNWKSKFKGLYADHNFYGQKVYFLKPATYMNLSGDSVQEFSHFFKIQPEEILTVYDEIDLDYGKVMIKPAGSAGGHNGIKSLIQRLGGDHFIRLRLGISRPRYGSVSDYVLGKFDNDEENKLQDYLVQTEDIILKILKDGYEKAASVYSKKNLLE